MENIKKAFLAEWLKIKGLGLIYFGIICGALIPVFVFIINIFQEKSRIYDEIPKTASQYSVESYIQGFGSFFLLIFIIISATRITQTDHKNNGWTFMETQPLSRFSIYLGKFLSITLLTFITISVFIISCISISSLTQLLFPQENLSFKVDFLWIFHTFIRLLVMSLGIVSLQMMLSTIIRGFVWPFLIGFVGFVINIVAKVRHETYDFVPYNNLQTSLSFKDSSELNHFFNYSEYLSLFWMILFFLIGYLIYSRRGFKEAFFKTNKKIVSTILGIALFAGLYFLITKPIYPEKLKDKTIVEGTIESKKPPKFVNILSRELKENIATIPVKDGVFRWENSGEMPIAEYLVDIDKKYYTIIFSKGDHIILTIKKDEKNFYVLQKGTRKAEAQFTQNEKREYSNFYDYVVKEKQLTNEPKSFYEKAQEEWADNEKFLNNYRTNENIFLAKDFYQYKQQQNAIRMLNAINDYQRMTSFSDSKFSPPKSFYDDLQNLVKKPTNLLLTNTDFIDWKTKNMLPENGAKNPDSIIFAKLNQMTKSLEKDNILKNHLLKVFDLTKDEAERNKIFAENANQFSNPKYANFIANELKIINNQQKGKPFPNLIFEDESGKKVSLSQFKGKYVVIDFWATWCAPCKETKPVFEFQAKKYKYQDNLVFLSASVDEDKNKWKLDIKNNESNVTQWWIANADALRLLGVESIPRFMMIDPQGKIYNSNMPRPNETNFEDILNKVSNYKSFNFEF